MVAAAARLRTLIIIVLALAMPASAQAPAPEPALPRTPNAREIRGLVHALGSDEWATREGARERLLVLGSEALPWLERARHDPDAQRALAAEELIRTLRWWVPPELRQTVGEALDDFAAQPPVKRFEAIAGLARLGTSGLPAVPFLVNVARFDPDPRVRLVSADVYLRLTPNGDEAHDRAMVEALKDEKDDGGVDLLLIRAQLDRRAGHPEEAAKKAVEAWNRAPTPQLAILVIDLLLDLGDVQAAVPIAAAAAQAAPNDVQLRIRLGEVLFRAGKPEEGLAALATVLEVPEVEKDEGALLRLGQAYLRCERPDEAERVFKQALGRFPYSRELNVARADVLVAQGRIAEAVEIFLNELRYATPDTPSEKGLRTRLGAILTRGGAGWLADDEPFFRDAMRGRPVVAVRLAVGEWLARRALVDEALDELRAAAALSPASLEVQLRLADALRDAGRIGAARAAYEAAQKADPESVVPANRLRDLGGLTEKPPAPEGGEAFTSWEWRINSADLARSPEAVAEGGPAPLVTGDRVVVPASGNVDLVGLDAADGALRWRFVPEPPKGEEGSVPEQIGLELVALVETPAATVAASHPRRAREGRPLVVAVYDAYWRPLHRSWRKARFIGLFAYLVDPKDGAALGRRELDLGAQVVPPAAAARRGRLLAFASPRSNRIVIEMIDLVRGRPLWQTGLPNAAMRRPVFAGDRVVVAWDGGVAALGADGAKAWTHERMGDAPEAEEGGVDAGRAISTGLGVLDDAVVFGTGDGSLVRLALTDGAVTELGKVGQARLGGEVVCAQGKVFVAERGGAIHAVELAPVASSTTAAPASATKAWTANAPRAAARTLTWAGELLFALNGSEDAFKDELPLLLALDPKTGQVQLQRPVDRPAQLASGDGLVVVAAGGRSSRAGLHVVGVRPAERLDRRASKLAALRSAAEDALFNQQYEISSVLARRLVQAAGGWETLDQGTLAFVARTLRRSNREDEALDAIHLGEEKGGADAQPFWDEVRAELKLPIPAPPPAPMGKNEESPAPGTEKPPTPGSETPPASEAPPATETPPASEAPPATEKAPPK